MSHDYTIVIPSRYHSKRFHGKPLANIQGKPMIEHCINSAKQSSASEVIVATDSDQIADITHKLCKTVMTPDIVRNGTERVATCIELEGIEGIIVNLQGDIPFINPYDLDNISRETEKSHLATLYTNRTSSSQVSIEDGTFRRDETSRYVHIGVYGYTTEILKKYIALPPSSNEEKYSLEQLRFTDNGYRFKAVKSLDGAAGQEVNTVDDLLLFNNRSEP